MGYDTRFSGRFLVRPHPLSEAQGDYLEAFSKSRRITYDGQRLANLEGYEDRKLREAAGIVSVGERGDYYVGPLIPGAWPEMNVAPGQLVWKETGLQLMPYSVPSRRQPGLWCQWIPTEDRTAIVFDEGEKFYRYVEWLEYLVKQFLTPWGYGLEGDVYWRGEAYSDVGLIRARVSPQEHGVAGTVITTLEGFDGE